LFVEWGLGNFFVALASNCGPPDLYLLSSWDYTKPTGKNLNDQNGIMGNLGRRTGKSNRLVGRGREYKNGLKCSTIRRIKRERGHIQRCCTFIHSSSIKE
jgi:hypothetical protein